MANTITLSSTGMKNFDDFEDGTITNEYNGTDFPSFTASALYYIANPSATGGPQTTNALQVTSNGSWVYLEDNTLTETELLIGCWYYHTVSNMQFGPFFMSTTSGADGNKYQCVLRHSSVDWYADWGINGNSLRYQNGTTDINKWEYIQVYMKGSASSQKDTEVVLLNTDGTMAMDYIGEGGNRNVAGYGGWRIVFGNSGMYLGNASICANKYITITGIVDGMKIDLVDNSGEQLYKKTAEDNTLPYSVEATTTSATIDIMGLPIPIGAKFRVIGTDGSIVLTSALQSLYGGDSWAYSGDSSTTTPNGKKRITGGDFK